MRLQSRAVTRQLRRLRESEPLDSTSSLQLTVVDFHAVILLSEALLLKRTQTSFLSGVLV